jgi:hypothetical protein
MDRKVASHMPFGYTTCKQSIGMKIVYAPNTHNL